MVKIVLYEAFACPCGDGDVVLRESYKLKTRGKLYYACPRSKPWQNTFKCKKILWKEERIRLLVGSLGASATPIYSPGSSSTPIYSLGASTNPIYSPGSSSTLIYSPEDSRNAKCSNCKHLLDKITVLEVTVEMYKNLEQHTLNSTALLHEVYNDISTFNGLLELCGFALKPLEFLDPMPPAVLLNANVPLALSFSLAANVSVGDCVGSGLCSSMLYRGLSSLQEKGELVTTLSSATFVAGNGLSILHFLKILKNRLEVLKVLKNSLEVLKVLKNSLEVLKVLKNSLEVLKVLQMELQENSLIDEEFPGDMSPGNMCHRSTYFLTGKYVGPTVSPGIVAGEGIPYERSPVNIPRRQVAGEIHDLSLGKRLNVVVVE
nr:hypothetical protein [Tanacetum cinerariifolium]